jgi:hypothetical protein
MVTTLKQAHVRTPQPNKVDPAPRMPHEHDESDDSQASGPRDDMRQAYEDIQSGQVDTDCREQRGVDQVAGNVNPCAVPRNDEDKKPEGKNRK